MMVFKISCIFTFLIFSYVVKAQDKNPFNPKDLDEFVQKLLKCRNFPAATVSILQLNDADDIVLQYTKGYGRIDPQCDPNSSCDNVDENTKFCIGSVTKAFTAGVIGKVLSDSKFKDTLWDTPIKNLLPSDQRNFIKGDVMAERVTVRDLLAHRMGLQDRFLALMMGVEDPRKEVWKNISILDDDRSVSPFWRSSFMYSNWMYALAGHISESLTNETWEELVQKFYFEPLSMKSSTFIKKQTGSSQSDWTKFAKYGILKNDSTWTSSNEIMKLLENVDGASSAGSICSTSTDMIQYLKFLLSNSSIHDGLVPKEIILDTFKPSNYLDEHSTIHMPQFPIYSATHTYGMGWGQGVYRDYRTVSHSGGIEGFVTNLVLLPDQKLGVFVSTTNDVFTTTGFAEIITLQAMDLALGKTPWIDINSACTIYPEAFSSANESAGSSDKSETNETNYVYVCNGLSEEFSRYEGIYRSSVSGTMHVIPNKSNGFLEFKLGVSGHGRLCRTNPPIDTSPDALRFYFDGVFESFNSPSINSKLNATVIFHSTKNMGEALSATLGFNENTEYHWIGPINSTV